MHSCSVSSEPPECQALAGYPLPKAGEISRILSSVQDVRPTQGCSGHPVSHIAVGTELILTSLSVHLLSGAEPHRTTRGTDAVLSNPLLLIHEPVVLRTFVSMLFITQMAFPRRGPFIVNRPLCSAARLEVCEDSLVQVLAGGQFGAPEAQWGGRW